MKYLLMLLIVFTTGSCQNNSQVDLAEEKKLLINTDILFSDMSAKEGMSKAFIHFIDSNGVLLRPNSFPIIGAKAKENLLKSNDSGFVITWHPDFSDVSKAGDLGYTFGTYTLKLNSSDSLRKGTYVSVWKKQHDGQWKFILDSGNEGLGKQ